MPNDSIQMMIERYKKELMEFEKKRPQSKPVPPMPPAPPAPHNLPAPPKKPVPEPPVRPMQPSPPLRPVPSAPPVKPSDEPPRRPIEPIRPIPPSPPSRPTPPMSPVPPAPPSNPVPPENGARPPMPQPRTSGRGFLQTSDNEPSQAKQVSAETELSSDEDAVSVNANGDNNTELNNLTVLTDDETVYTPNDSGEENFTQNGNQYPPYNSESNEYDTYDELLRSDTKTGMLRVQTYVGDRLFPISNARVIVVKKLGGSDYTFYDEQTDSSGVVYGLTLPCPDKNLTEYPTALMPYETYNVWVEHPKYYKALFVDVLIFDGIETTQNVSLMLKKENEENDIVQIYTKDGMYDYNIEE